MSLVDPGVVTSPIWDKLQSADKYEELVSPANRTLYAHMYDRLRVKLPEVNGKGDGPEVVAAAVLDALVSETPKPRYFVANMDGIPAWLMIPLLAVLPDRFIDLLTTRL